MTSWKGRVEISWPAGATPMTHDWPQPLWAHSSALRITWGALGVCVCLWVCVGGAGRGGAVSSSVIV